MGLCFVCLFSVNRTGVTYFYCPRHYIIRFELILEHKLAFMTKTSAFPIYPENRHTTEKTDDFLSVLPPAPHPNPDPFSYHAEKKTEYKMCILNPLYLINCHFSIVTFRRNTWHYFIFQMVHFFILFLR